MEEFCQVCGEPLEKPEMVFGTFLCEVCLEMMMEIERGNLA